MQLGCLLWFERPLLADIGKLGVDLAAHLAERVLGDADAAGVGDALQPRGDVDAVAEDDRPDCRRSRGRRNIDGPTGAEARRCTRDQCCTRRSSAFRLAAGRRNTRAGAAPPREHLAAGAGRGTNRRSAARAKGYKGGDYLFGLARNERLSAEIMAE